jgi:hypothetical protein
MSFLWGNLLTMDEMGILILCIEQLNQCRLILLEGQMKESDGSRVVPCVSMRVEYLVRCCWVYTRRVQIAFPVDQRLRHRCRIMTRSKHASSRSVSYPGLCIVVAGCLLVVVMFSSCPCRVHARLIGKSDGYAPCPFGIERFLKRGRVGDASIAGFVRWCGLTLGGRSKG